MALRFCTVVAHLVGPQMMIVRFFQYAIGKLCLAALRVPLLGVALAASLHAASGDHDSSSMSLAGEWRFALDRSDVGVSEAWYGRALPDRIKLPGILQAQGYGDEIRTDTPWVASLGDAWWKVQPQSLRARFSQPGHVEVPFLAQPPRHYLGAAWYQRDIEIPRLAAGRRFVLFLERAHWQTKVWVDDREYAPNDSLVAPHITDLGALTPGRHRLTIRVDNRQIVRDPVNDGHGVDSHSVSDALGATWNGIVGQIVLQSTAATWIDDVQVFPAVEKKSAVVVVAIGNATGQAGSGEIQMELRPPAGGARNEHSLGGIGPVTWTAEGGKAKLEVPLGDAPETWDEFHPVLQRLVVTLRTNGTTLDTREATFGLREVGHEDKDLLINGRLVNLRTTHFGGDFPLTGYPATDVDTWKRIFRVCQDYGLNGMRFHSWCPPEAAFVAADELGFYLQPECGLWAPFTPDGPYTKFLEQETARMLKAFGNHPSFILLSPSNEPAAAYTQITPKWAADWHEKDPRRLYAAATGWAAPEQVTGGPQYATLVRFGGNDLRNMRGWFGHDYRAALENIHIPVLAHEIGQWCSYPDFDVVKEFTGYLRPGNYHIFEYIAQQTGVLEYDHAFAWASGRFQVACYKEEIEANLRTPHLAGFQLLDLHDYLGQGTALIGVVDAFWKSKGYVTAAEFRRFDGATVPLARLTRRTFTTDETLSADVELYHFGARPLAGAKPYWKIVTSRAVGAGRLEEEQVVAQGTFATLDVPIGKNIPLGQVAVDLAKLAAPAAYKLVVGLTGTPVENDWMFWLYPAKIDAAVPSDVTVTSEWTEAEAKLAAGGKVLFVPTARDLDPNRCPAMRRTPVFWNIQMTVRPPRNTVPQFDAMLGLLCDTKHPALAGFPTAPNCDWQWTPLIAGVRSVNLTGAPRALKPIVATIDDWNRNWRLGAIVECNVDRGRLLVCVIPLDGPDVLPGARQLRRSLLDYMATPRFRPAVTMTLADVRQWWMASDKPTAAPRARAYDADLDDGTARPTPPAKP